MIDYETRVLQFRVDALEKHIEALRARVKKLEGALREIEERGEKCWCDRGYPGGCGCGRSCSEMAYDALNTETEER